MEVSSTGLESTSIQLEAISANDEELKGICASTENKEMEVVMGSLDEIPIRKIEIVSEDGQEFDINKKEIIVKAKLYPENASYKEINWSAVNESGIVSKLEFKVNGLEAIFKNPYEFVSGGLFDHDVTGNVGNGNEKGLCSDR